MKIAANRRRAGLTTIEIVVVLAVIGVLGAVAVLTANKLSQMAAIRAITQHILATVGAHSSFVESKGSFSTNSGLSFPGTMSGTNYSTSTSGQAGAYTDFRMVYVTNGFMRVDEIMFTVPRSIQGGITGTASWPDFGTLASQLSSTDGMTWTRNPDIAITGAGYPMNILAFETGGQPAIACSYRIAAPLRPAENGASRTGNALQFTIWVGDATYELIQTKLEETLGRTKGYYITVTNPQPGVRRIQVTTPALAF